MTEPVLVLRALGLGDALTGVPALRGLRRLHSHRPLVLAAPEDIGRWFVGLGLVDAFVTTSGLDVDPPGRRLGPHDAVNLHGRGPQSHALLLAAGPRSLLAFAPPQSQDGRPGPGADATTHSIAGTLSQDRSQDGRPGPGADATTHSIAGTLPRWRADEPEVLRWCRLVRWAGGPCGPADLRLGADLRPDPDMRRTRDEERASRTQERTTGGMRPGVVLLHPGAASASRRWPVDRWAAVARVLSSRADVRLTGSQHERQQCLQVARAAGLDDDSVVAGTLDLPQLMAVVAHARLLVCGDTGVAHVATATGTPSVLLFGPTAPRLWGPLIDHERHVCLWHGDGTGDPHGSEPDPALLRINVGEVLAAADALLTRELGVA